VRRGVAAGLLLAYGVTNETAQNFPAAALI
jgi:hypothetical protein